jgi:hypothetical protein
MESFVKVGNMNCVHTLLTAQAVMMTFLKKNQSTEYRYEVKRSFDKAINAAHRSGFNNDAGFAGERAALFMQAFDAAYAEDYLKEAYARFFDWGNFRKLEHIMESNHSCLKESAASRRMSRRSSSMGSTASSTGGGGGGRMNARSRYKENAVEQHRTLTF